MFLEAAYGKKSKTTEAADNTITEKLPREFAYLDNADGKPILKETAMEIRRWVNSFIERIEHAFPGLLGPTWTTTHPKLQNLMMRELRAQFLPFGYAKNDWKTNTCLRDLYPNGFRGVKRIRDARPESNLRKHKYEDDDILLPPNKSIRVATKKKRAPLTVLDCLSIPPPSTSSTSNHTEWPQRQPLRMNNPLFGRFFLYISTLIPFFPSATVFPIPGGAKNRGTNEVITVDLENDNNSCMFFFPSFFHPVLSPALTTISAVVQIAPTLPTSPNIDTILARDSGTPIPLAVSTLPLMPISIAPVSSTTATMTIPAPATVPTLATILTTAPAHSATMLAPSPDALSCTPAVAATTLTASLTPSDTVQDITTFEGQPTAVAASLPPNTQTTAPSKKVNFRSVQSSATDNHV